MPRGRKDKYYEELFLQFVNETPQNTEEIRKKINEKFSSNLSWNTVQKYLEKLEKEGKIACRRVSDRYNLWFVSKVGELGGKSVQKVSE
jgi:predicted transcriptional regulator